MTWLLASIGLLLGLTAALVWHVAVPGSPSPDWWPSLPLLAGLGTLVGWFAAACANAEGWRVVRGPDAGYRPLVVLAGGTALVAGCCFAWAWAAAPPATAMPSMGAGSPWLTFPILCLVVAGVATGVAYGAGVRVVRRAR